ARETDTAHTDIFDVDWPNSPLRVLRNQTVDSWEAAGCPAVGRRPREDEVVGHNELGEPVLRYSSSAPTAGTTGEIEAMMMYAGQSVGLVDRLLPAGEIVRQVADEAARVLERTRGLIGSDVVA